MHAIGLSPLEAAGLIWFFGFWIAYTYFSRYRAKTKPRLQNLLHAHIREWIKVLHNRDLRIVDTSIVANMERNSTFFASSSLLIIAGLLTAIGSSDAALSFLNHLTFGADINPTRWDVCMVLLTLIYTYTFFTFTWTTRQWGFASILIGSAPLHDDAKATLEERQRNRQSLARLIWLAIYNFNLGLRGYYFSLALLIWLALPEALFVTTVWVVAVLYRREFHSRSLAALQLGLETHAR